jgi:hypothetical protein
VTGSNRGINTADRIALAAMFAVAILILAIVGLTYKSATHPMAAVAAMSSSLDLLLSRIESSPTEQRAELPSGEREKEPSSRHRRRPAR